MRELKAAVRSAAHAVCFLWRWFSGYPLHGPHAHRKFRTDAGWFHHATKVTHPTGQASWWYHLPFFPHRCAIRGGGTVFVLGSLAGLAASPLITELVLAVLAAAGLAVAGRWARQKIRTRPYRREVTRPAAAALAPLLHLTVESAAARLALDPAPEEKKGGQIVGRLPLPDGAQTGDDRWIGKVEGLLESRIPAEVSFRWLTAERPMRLEIVRSVTPPDEVLMGDWVSYVDGLPPFVYFLGVRVAPDGSYAPEDWDTTGEDPHAVLQAGTQRGKTNELLNIAGTCLRRGGLVSAVDPKRTSLLALKGVPGMTLAHDPKNVTEMWQVIRDVWAEVDKVSDFHMTHPGTPIIERLLIIEEAGMFRLLSETAWKETGRPGKPDIFPVIRKIMMIGAEYGFRVLTDGQDLDHETLFGSRPLYGTALMGGYRPRHWRMFCGDAKWQAPGKAKGRFLVVRESGEDLRWVQAPIFDKRNSPAGKRANTAAWREFALNGRTAADVSRERAYRPERDWLLRRSLPPGRPPRTALPSVPAGGLPPVIVGLRQGADAVGMPVSTFRLRRRQCPIPGEFIATGRSPAWQRDWLLSWARDLESDSAPVEAEL